MAEPVTAMFEFRFNAAPGDGYSTGAVFRMEPAPLRGRYSYRLHLAGKPVPVLARWAGLERSEWDVWVEGHPDTTDTARTLGDALNLACDMARTYGGG